MRIRPRSSLLAAMAPALILAGVVGCGSSSPTISSDLTPVSTDIPSALETKAPDLDDGEVALSTEGSTSLEPPIQRIVGGTPASEGEWPSTAALILASSSNPASGNFCGGVLIRPDWVLTAAHCLFDGRGRVRPPSYLDVVLGRTDLRDSRIERIDVRQIVVHPSYNPRFGPPAGFDVALLELATSSSQPTLPLIPVGSGLDQAGVLSTTVGWGTTSFGGSDSNVLLEVEVPIVSNTTCNQRDSYNGAIKSDMVCAGFASGGRDACQGDSGGPLMAQSGSTWYSVGIVSWGDGCAAPNKYGVYTRVSTYVNWINSQVGSSTPTPTPTPAPTGSSSISVPQTINGSLTSSDPNNPTRSGRYKDDYQLTGVSAGQTIQIDLSSSQVDTYLQIIDAATGSVVAANDDFSGTNSRVLLSIASGRTYVIRVTSYALRETGSYTLSTQNLSQPTPTPAPTGDTLSVPQTRSGSLSSSDSDNPTRTGAYRDDYQLIGVSAGQSVRLDLNSSQFDTYLQLINASTGSVIAFNDDRFFSTDSRLSFTVSSGVTYIVRVTSYFADATGSYTLTAQ